jgi:PAS domain-containing protein
LITVDSFFSANQLPCGLVCFDDSGRLLAANAEMLRLLGHGITLATKQLRQLFWAGPCLTF